jgi:5-methylcytosine-specific restriction protein A
MPSKPPTFRPPGVNVWKNERERKAAIDRTRDSRQQRGYDKAWFEFRARYLRARPQCQHPGCAASASELHHIKRVRTHPHLRLDPSNVMGLCKPHHSAETARHDGFARG